MECVCSGFERKPKTDCDTYDGLVMIQVPEPATLI
jgi:hypothetical protein